MLKSLIYFGSSIFMVLLLIAPVSKTEKYNIINTIDTCTCYYHNNYYHEDCKSLESCNHFLLNFTHVLQHFISIILNGTCVYDSLSFDNRFETGDSSPTTSDLVKLHKFHGLLRDKFKNIQTRPERYLTPNVLKDTINYYINDALPFNSTLQKSVKESSKYQENRKDEIEYRWRRRSLCAISNKEKDSTEELLEDKIPGEVHKERAEKRKTLLDYDTPILTSDLDDSDSLKAHVRVKRSRFESNPISLVKYQQDYLKDLANSFPRNGYESIDENSDNDDMSFDVKREIESQEYFTNNEPFDASSGENDQPKIVNAYPFTVPAYLGEDNSAGSDSISASSDVTNKANTFKKGQQEVELSRESSNNIANDGDIVNRKLREDSEVLDLPEDPMLTVELVRERRNNYGKIYGKRNLRKKDVTDGIGETFSGGKSERNINPSSLVHLKADLLRLKRKTKNRNEKKSKSKKKKKYVGKKHNSPSNSARLKDVVPLRKTDRLRAPRERKSNEAKSEGKSKASVVANVVDRRNNDNNFRRRSVKAKESIAKRDSESNQSRHNIASTLKARLKQASENKNDDDAKVLPVSGKSSEIESVSDFKPEKHNNLNVSESQSQKHETLVEDKNPVLSLQDLKLRTKRNKNTESRHGFLNKEEELRYYENIREPGSEVDECDDGGSQLLVGNEVEGNRAVRSIEEVKELAKKLVTKVNELQSYLNVEEAIGKGKQERKIETRAIDELCSNVTSNCGAFKEAPRIVEKCAPAHHNFQSTAKLAERNVDPLGTSDEQKLVKNANKHSTEKKRSIGSRRIIKAAPTTSRTVRKEDGKTSRRKWGKWTDWSSCSVTCGKGRQIRWRYCLRDCSTAETEMEEKACQLPACPPGKFLGIF